MMIFVVAYFVFAVIDSTFCVRDTKKSSFENTRNLLPLLHQNTPKKQQLDVVATVVQVRLQITTHLVSGNLLNATDKHQPPPSYLQTA